MYLDLEEWGPHMSMDINPLISIMLVACLKFDSTVPSLLSGFP